MAWARRQIDPGSPLPFGTGENGVPADVPSPHMLVTELPGGSYSAAMEAPDVIAAAAVWEECMSGLVDGYHGTSASGEGAAAEAAVPSVERKDSSGYLDAFVCAERDLLDGLVAEHERRSPPNATAVSGGTWRPHRRSSAGGTAAGLPV